MEMRAVNSARDSVLADRYLPVVVNSKPLDSMAMSLLVLYINPKVLPSRELADAFTFPEQPGDKVQAIAEVSLAPQRQ